MTRDGRTVAAGVGRLIGRLRRARRSARTRRDAAIDAGLAAGLEPLENRWLMSVGVTMTTTAPIISEFLAVNSSGLRDQDGQRSDWIELYNPTAGDVNLDGYYLTDDSTVLNKWRIPAVTLPSGTYLTVFASGKDRAVAGQELHTNFTLDGAGEYLGLVAPNGTTVLSDYSPTYPPQVADVSYGVSVNQSTRSLIGPRSTARTLVPTDGSLGNTWTQTAFNDASWIAGTTGVGYERETPVIPPPIYQVRMVDVDPGAQSQIPDINTAAAILDSSDGTANGAFVVQNTYTQSPSVINMGSGGSFGGDLPLPNGVTDSSTELYALRATTKVFIPAGQWTINVNSDDGFRLKLPGVQFLTPTNGELPSPDTFEFPGLRGAANSFVTFTVPDGGLNTTLQLDFFENMGGDSVELSVASGFRSAFSTSVFSLLGNGVQGWQVADPATNVPPNYRSLLGTDIEAQTFNKTATAYIRVPFSVLNANDYGSLRLQMKYDDGFVAYLNGVEVARRNAPATLAYNSTAAANRPDTDALVYESMSLPVSALRSGSNVLAIQGLNTTISSSDFLIFPEVQGVTIQLNDQARYLSQPTPGGPNSADAGDGIVQDTSFSVDRGFFDQPFQLAITTPTEGATIRYTTDGTPPTANTGTVYAGPITISRTTTLRAAAFKTNFLPTNVDTQTYIFTADVIRQSPTVAPGPGWPAADSRVNNQIINYGMDPDIVNSATWGPQMTAALKALPSFSIVTDPNNLFNPQTGIYVNPGGDGLPWERPASVELINPDGSKGFQIDAGLRIRGGFSRTTDNPKHAFRLFFRASYDGSLKYPLFGADGAQSFDGIDLRTTQNYSWAFQGDRNSIFMRDQFSRDVQLAMGQPAERGKWYHLYIDGQYWGLFNTDERAEANYGASYFGGNSDDYDTIKVDPDLGYNIEATDGNMDAWNQLYQLLAGTVTEDVFQQIQGNKPDGTPDLTKPVLLNVDNLIDYMLVIYYGGNLDAPISNFLGNNSPNNFFAVRNRNLDARMGFVFFAHDAEHTLLDVNQNRLGPSVGTGWPAGDGNVLKSSPQWFFQRLWNLPSFKARVADHVQEQMINPGGVLTPAKVRERLLGLKAIVQTAVIAESARWGDSKVEPPITQNDYLNAWNNVLNNYVPQRTNIVLGQLRQWGLLPSFSGPVFNQQGGQVAAGFGLTMTPATGTPAGSSIYYTVDGTDPRNRDGSISPTAIRYTGPVIINDTVTVRARTLTTTNVWSPMNRATFSLNVSALKITELMYNPPPPPAGAPSPLKDDYEYIELQNTGDTPLDLEGIKLVGGVSFTFPANFTLAPGARAVVVKNRAAFESRYGTGAANIAGTYTSSLSDSGEEIKLLSAIGATLLDFTYSDSWYPNTDGEGFSLNVVNTAAVAAAWSTKSNWRPSNRSGGSPGADDPGPMPDDVQVNELLANPLGGGAGDFIELHNTTALPVDIGGWYVSDSATDLKKYRIPSGTVVAAGGYLVLDQATLGFDLSAAGGEVFVSGGDPVTGDLMGYRESSRYTASDPGVSFGQLIKSTGGSDFVALTNPTPGAANAKPLVGPIVINEVMYQPATGKAEYIELRNLTGSDVLLNDPANATGAWKFVDGIDYVFPAGATVPAFGYAIVSAVDSAIFRSQYDIPPGVPIFGPYQRADGTNNLENVGENLTLYRPTAAGYALADRLNYTNAAPWPTGASGTGQSIVRVASGEYGNDAGNWLVEAGGSPGRQNLDTDRPTADVIDVSPDPRTTPIDQIRIVFSEPVRGFDAGDLSLTGDNGAELLTGAETLATTDNITWTLSGLSALTANPGSYIFTVISTSTGITDWKGNPLALDAGDSWRVGAPPTGRVVGRYTFYDNSRFDGGVGVASDDAAMANDKQALLPGQVATFQNYTSYSRGINGVMIDVAGLQGDPTAADFSFHVGNDGDPGSWTTAPAPTGIVRRPGAGTNGSDRIVLTWADRAIQNQWLRVTVLPTTRTGLPAADVFYFGNLVGETGDNTNAAAVTDADLVMVRRNLTIGSRTVPLNSRYDFDRNGRVDALDLILARRGVVAGSLTLLNAPAGGVAGAAAVAPSGTTGVASVSSAAVFSQSAIAPASTSDADSVGSLVRKNSGGVLGAIRTDVLGRV